MEHLCVGVPPVPSDHSAGTLAAIVPAEPTVPGASRPGAATARCALQITSTSTPSHRRASVQRGASDSCSAAAARPSDRPVVRPAPQPTAAPAPAPALAAAPTPAQPAAPPSEAGAPAMLSGARPSAVSSGSSAGRGNSSFAAATALVLECVTDRSFEADAFSANATLSASVTLIAGVALCVSFLRSSLIRQHALDRRRSRDDGCDQPVGPVDKRTEPRCRRRRRHRIDRRPRRHRSRRPLRHPSSASCRSHRAARISGLDDRGQVAMVSGRRRDDRLPVNGPSVAGAAGRAVGVGRRYGRQPVHSTVVPLVDAARPRRAARANARGPAGPDAALCRLAHACVEPIPVQSPFLRRAVALCPALF